MKYLFTILVLVFSLSVGFGQGGVAIGGNGGSTGGGVVDSTRLVQDSILVYYIGGNEVGRDTVRTGFGETTSAQNFTLTTSSNAEIDAAISTFGIAAVYSTPAGNPTRANTSTSSSLHHYYLSNYQNGAYSVYGAGVQIINASFSYQVNQVYYVQDDGGFATNADADFDSAALHVIKNLGNNNYLVCLRDPRHF